jgi:hypothetical protein
MSRIQAEISTVKLVANLSNLEKHGQNFTRLANSAVDRGHRPEGGTVMPFIAVAIAALAVGFEALVQWKWGAMGIVAFVALTIGVKSKNLAIGGIGAVILVMLLAQSG